MHYQKHLLRFIRHRAILHIALLDAQATVAP